MSIAGRLASILASLVLASIVLAPGGAALADEPQASRESPPAGSAATSAATETTTPTPAEPLPAVPAAPPVMPTIVVRPSGVETAAPASSTTGPLTTTKPADAAARPRTAAGATAPPKAAATPPRTVSLGRHGVIELGRPASAASRWHGFPISLSLRDAPLPEVLRSFARIAGVNLVLAPGVTGSVTVELTDVPWDQALWVILKTHGLGAEIDGRVWTVEPY